MAVNTADKRASAVNISLPWRTLFPQPGSLTVGDRFQAAAMYRGFADDGQITPPSEDDERISSGQMLHMSKWMNR